MNSGIPQGSEGTQNLFTELCLSIYPSHQSTTHRQTFVKVGMNIMA